MDEWSISKVLIVLRSGDLAAISSSAGPILLMASCCTSTKASSPELFIEWPEKGLPLSSAGLRRHLAQFRNPNSPLNPNYFKLTASVSLNEGSVNGGDSGGPLWISTSSGLVQIGVLKGGIIDFSDTYGGINRWTPVNLFLNWIRQNDPLRYETNIAGNFNWSNAGAWKDSIDGIASAVPDNSALRYYDVTLSQAGRVTLDVNATIDRLSIANASASLLISKSFGLTSLINSTMTNGLLTINGTLTTPRLLAYGGLISGTGTIVGDVFVNYAGRIDSGPIDGTGELFVKGNTAFNKDPATLQVDISRTANDLLDISGTADLGGEVVASVEHGAAAHLLSRRMTILTADGGVTGKFGIVSTELPLSFLTPRLSYDGNNVYLDYNLTPFSIAARNINQRNIGNALTLGALGPVSEAGANILNALFYGNYQTAQSVMDTAGGAGLAGAQTTAIEVGQMASSAVADQIAFWRSGEANDPTGLTLHDDVHGTGAHSFLAYAPIEAGVKASSAKRAAASAGTLPPATLTRTFRAWGSMFGGGATFAADIGRGAPSATAGYYGGLIGVDYQLQPNMLLGVAVGGSNANFSAGSLATSGSLTGFHASLYGAYTLGTNYLALNETFSTYSNQTNRTAGGYGFLPYEQLNARFGSTEFRTRLEGGRTFGIGGFKATPFIAAEIAAYSSNAFTESSSLWYQSSLALTNNGQSSISVPTFIGLRLTNGIDFANGWRLTPVGSLAYVHEFSPRRQLTNTLMSLPDQGFAVAGPRSTYNLVQTKIGAELSLSRQLSVFADFQGEFSSASQSYGGKGGVRYVWYSFERQRSVNIAFKPVGEANTHAII
ncbi:autotransporter outer membrane beta-barrel domain-containing protein [Methylocystis sp. MJC1]|uniref:autotransporter family protein n=1 Tax=Methylocystis sp. MJC1 TaxID=2654282 RepID=UPI0019D24D54|nr:autotransporter outer membrane beta-barrel domain-containing protein [Methylocystis sp. MJC1]